MENPGDANSICLAMPNMTIKAIEGTKIIPGNVALKASKDAHLANIVSHYKGTAQIKDLSLDQGLLAARPCIKCKKRNNVVAGAWGCTVCKIEKPFNTQMKIALRKIDNIV